MFNKYQSEIIIIVEGINKNILTENINKKNNAIIIKLSHKNIVISLKLYHFIYKNNENEIQTINKISTEIIIKFFLLIFIN